MASTNDGALQRALSQLLTELFDGPPGDQAYFLNPGDPGLLRQLDGLTAEQASTPPGHGRKTVAAHVDHVLYGLELLNRWAAGEVDPWKNADWDARWELSTLSDAEWRSLRERLRNEANTWRTAIRQRTGWNDFSSLAALSSAIHAGYHLGAIRQIVAAIETR